MLETSVIQQWPAWVAELAQQSSVHVIGPPVAGRRAVADKTAMAWMQERPRGPICSRCGGPTGDERGRWIVADDCRASICWKCTYVLSEKYAKGLLRIPKEPKRTCLDCGEPLPSGRKRVGRCPKCRRSRRRNSERASRVAGRNT